MVIKTEQKKREDLPLSLFRFLAWRIENVKASGRPFSLAFCGNVFHIRQGTVNHFPLICGHGIEHCIHFGTADILRLPYGHPGDLLVPLLLVAIHVNQQTDPLPELS